jgi:uncharacterized Zn-binding protein involved in type VI secretion
VSKQGARSFVAVGVLALALVGCSSTDDAPEVTPAPANAQEQQTETPTTTPTPTAEPAASVGTREAPLAIGESRKVSDESAWTVALTASNLDAAPAILAADQYASGPAEGESFITGTFTITVDGAAIAAQGSDLANDGADPAMSLFMEYVAADGTSYDQTSGSMCNTQNSLWNQGAVFQDGASVSGDACIAIPTSAVQGGLWRVSNSVNDSVWFASS